MKKILIGIICDGNAGGLDNYILNFYQKVLNDSIKIDFLTNIADNPLKQKVAQNGSDVFCIPSLNNPVKQYSEAKKLFEEQNYDIVYLNISTAVTFPVFLAAKMAKVKKIIAHSHSSGFDIQNKYKRFIMTVLHKICKHILSVCCTDFLTCSQKAAEWLFTKSAIRNNDIKHIQNTIDITKFQFDQTKRDSIREQLNLKDKFVIGTAGNMVFVKNHLFLLDVFSIIAKKDDSARLVIAGDGPLFSLIENRIKNLKLSDKVILPGRIDISKGYMSAFDVFALPSFFEGMPIVSLEAQCAKLPCVLSDTITRESKISNMCDFSTIKNADIFANAILKYKGINRESFAFTKDLQCFSSESQKEVFRNIIS